jgi:hypothetical protein
VEPPQQGAHPITSPTLDVYVPAQANAHATIVRHAATAGIATEPSTHNFRATGIKAYFSNGGALKKAAPMTNHASTRIAQLYERRREQLSLDEVERISV